MKNKNLLFCLVALSPVALGFSPRDDDPLKTLLDKLKKFSTEFPQEKVHLHFDKPYYSIGDTIWFKSYILDATDNGPSPRSNILYVDLINGKDSVQKTLLLPVENGVANGDFTLGDSIPQGNYRVRAYTNWMRNFGAEYFFDKNIYIGNAFSTPVITQTAYTFSRTGNNEGVGATVTYTDLDGNPYSGKRVNYNVELGQRTISRGTGTTDAAGKLLINFVNNQSFNLKAGIINTTLFIDEKKQVRRSIPVKSTSESSDLQFFPEGGNLVDSLRSRVGFKAVNNKGGSLDITGKVTNQDNEVIAEIRTDHAGIGYFPIIPLKGQVYSATVSFPDGSEKRFVLPKSQPDGFVLSVSGTDSVLNVRIAASREMTKGSEVTLVAQVNGVVGYVSKSKMNTPVILATIPRNRFPAGIVQLTLFDGDMKPVAERLAFNRGKMLSIDAGTKSSYLAHEKVNMNIGVVHGSEPVRGNFSVAVTDFTKVPVNEVTETSIYSNILLGADIRGYIEQPNYYFTDVKPEKDRQLDNLLLTQGWRRISWKDIQSGTFPALAYPAERTLSVSGTVTTLSNKPVANGKVTLLSTGGNTLLLDTLTGPDGRFVFDNLVFADNTQFVVQARNSKGQKNVEIVLDRSQREAIVPSKNAADAEVNIDPMVLSYLQKRSDDFDELRKNGLLRNSILLGEVKLASVKKPASFSSNLNGAGNADVTIQSDKLQNFYSLEQAISGRVAGLIFRNGIPYLVRNLNSSLSRGPIPMALVVDGVMVPPDYITSIQPSDVETVEILKSAANTAIYGTNGGGGVLIVTTKRGESNLNYTRISPGITTYQPKGYTISRQFYSPKFDEPGKASLPDLRSTVYWNPAVQSDGDGRAAIDFYTAESPGTYRVVIEGVSEDGILGRSVHYFTVK